MSRLATVSTGWKTISSAIPADPTRVSHSHSSSEEDSNLIQAAVQYLTPSYILYRQTPSPVPLLAETSRVV
jgi:hypothetical protein